MSGDNPVDLALRGFSPRKLESAHMWFICSAFLGAPEEEWPDQPKFVAKWFVQEPDVKICTKICCTTKTSDSKNTLLRPIRAPPVSSHPAKGSCLDILIRGLSEMEVLQKCRSTSRRAFEFGRVGICPREQNIAYIAVSVLEGARQTVRASCRK